MNRLSSKGTTYHFNAVIFQEDGWWVGFIEEVPGVNAQAKTQTELHENLVIALKDIIEVQREELLASVPKRFKEVSIDIPA